MAEREGGCVMNKLGYELTFDGFAKFCEPVKKNSNYRFNKREQRELRNMCSDTAGEFIAAGVISQDIAVAMLNQVL